MLNVNMHSEANTSDAITSLSSWTTKSEINTTLNASGNKQAIYSILLQSHIVNQNTINSDFLKQHWKEVDHVHSFEISTTIYLVFHKFWELHWHIWR